MTLPIPTDDAARAALAGEYVLGTLDARTTQAVNDAIARDADFAALVADWEQRLAPLTALAVPEAPPPDLWARIEQQITPPSPAPRPARRAPFSFQWVWRAWALGASLAVLLLAFLPMMRREAAPVMTTILLADANQTAWEARVDPTGGIQLAALASPGGTQIDTAPTGHDLQLWALAPGEKTPVSLGLVPRGQHAVQIATPPVRPVPGMLILISLEPPGGAPGALPTGPVVFVGRLSQAGPPT